MCLGSSRELDHGIVNRAFRWSASNVSMSAADIRTVLDSSATEGSRPGGFSQTLYALAAHLCFLSPRSQRGLTIWFDATCLRGRATVIRLLARRGVDINKSLHLFCADPRNAIKS